MLLSCVARADDSELASLREILIRVWPGKVLSQEDPKVQYGLSVPDNDARLKAIQELEARSSTAAVGILKDFLTTHYMDPQLKQHALTALGRIGTQESVKAITKFESWSKTRFLKPPPFKFGRMNAAIDHIRPGKLGPLAKAADEKGRTWAIFAWAFYGTSDIWLTSSKIHYIGSKPILQRNIWSEPILLNAPAILNLIDMAKSGPDKTLRLEVKGDTVTVTYNGKTATASITESQKDSDKDKLPDLVEARLYADPDNPDTDNDGVPDGSDSNPLTAKHKETDDVTEIRQAVFSVLFATADCRDAIYIVDNAYKGDYAKQEYYGYGGFVLRCSPKSRQGFVNVTEIGVNIESPTTANAYIGDYEGNLAGGTHVAKLKKINGKWVVVEFALVEIF
jgi:hypothetical protein